ncbi:unnamed protein product, partial [Durusdinium trenchii]
MIGQVVWLKAGRLRRWKTMGGVLTLVTALGPALLGTRAGTLLDLGKVDPCDGRAALEDLGWLQQYIEIGFFTDYRNQAWHYYMTNETTYAFLWLNSISYANLDFLREACPEAAKLALLLRAEERLPAREAELPLLDLAQVTSDASSAWPVLEGVQRVKRLAQHMAVVQ